MFPPNPFDGLRVLLQAAQIMAESQTVIALRLSGLAGFWPMGGAEAARMVTEKLTAGNHAAQAALRAGLAGGSLPVIALAAMQPVRRRTRANARRLTASASR
jgi:hypothetical protein